MLSFCGQDRTSLDANGRAKFTPRVISDFQESCEGSVVLHCLPEGALAIYPEQNYLDMRRAESKPSEKAGSSLLFRRNLRRFGALSMPDTVSKQGRITIPQGYRKMLELNPNDEIIIVGIEIGIEIWNAKKWEEELLKINSHIDEKGELEMRADLTVEGIRNE